MKGLIRRGLSNTLVLGTTALVVLGVWLLRDHIADFGVSPDSVQLLLVPLALGWVSAFVLRGRWWIRILLITVPALSAGVLYSWLVGGGHSAENSLAIAYLMMFLGVQAFVAVITALVWEGIRIRRSSAKKG